MERKIQMVDLIGQYNNIKQEVSKSIQEVLDSAAFINGKAVQDFAVGFSSFTGAKYVIPCANGTDALQIAMMALDLEPGDEVIVPAFTYVATAEVLGLLGLTPVMVDVDPETFNVRPDLIEAAITPKTKAIVPVHLFGQSAQMNEIMAIASKHGLYVVEDNAQAIGADYNFTTGKRQTGTIGHIGCTSFFPSKNLGCYGDGGAIMTDDEELYEKLKLIANHGQKVKYRHDIIGVNSRLDSLQAAVLNVKLKYLKRYIQNRQKAASVYNDSLTGLDGLVLPKVDVNSTHVFHQYTLRVADDRRDALKKYLESSGIPSMIYYPYPLHFQNAFKKIARIGGDLSASENLCNEVLSLPMHTELKEEELAFITKKIKSFYA